MARSLAAVCRLGPDVVALQQVTPYTAELWRPALIRAGWCSVVFSSIAHSSFSPTGPRRYGLVLPSRLPLVAHDPERVSGPMAGAGAVRHDPSAERARRDHDDARAAWLQQRVGQD